MCIRDSGYGGGGATDVRLVPTSSETVWRENDSLASRIIIAGGGGGAAYYSYGTGGYGGGLVGGAGVRDSRLGAEYTPPQGGSQTAGGSYGSCGPGWCSGLTDGTFAYGGTGGTSGGYAPGGGGGGYYGGGGGGSGYSYSGACGSSYISGYLLSLIHI